MIYKPSRRRFLQTTAGGLAVSAFAAPFVHTTKARSSDILYVNSWGGSWTEAERAAFFDPFTAETGIEVETVEPVSYAKLKAQAETGIYEWDVSSQSRTNVLRSDRLGYVEPLNYDIIDEAALPEGTVFSNSIAFCVLGTGLAYRTDAFPNGGPESWADFWDVEKFPGRRSMYNNAYRSIVYALLADGVPADQLYPLDLDRAFAKLDEIKPHITVWWTQGNQSQQLLRDREVDMIVMWNARATEVENQGYPVRLVWNEMVVEWSPYCCVAGAPNADAAMMFMEFVTRPEPQASFANSLRYGPVNPAAFDLIPEEVSVQLPTYAPNATNTIQPDTEWEADNADQVEERFAQWLAS